jgi:hypothetical protein
LFRRGSTQTEDFLLLKLVQKGVYADRGFL